jgi:hypothetical protein
MRVADPEPTDLASLVPPAHPTELTTSVAATARRTMARRDERPTTEKGRQRTFTVLARLRGLTPREQISTVSLA